MTEKGWRAAVLRLRRRKERSSQSDYSRGGLCRRDLNKMLLPLTFILSPVGDAVRSHKGRGD